MERRRFLGTLATGAVAAGTLGAMKPAKAADFAWRMANLYPRGVSYGPVYQAFAERVGVMSGGRLTIEAIFDGEGVGATEVLQAASTGLVEAGCPYMALHAGELPAGIVAAVSFVFISASNELGDFEAGLMARIFGPVLAVTIGGGAAIVASLGWIRLFPELAKADGFEPPPRR